VNSKELADKAEELGVTGPDGVKWRERALLAEGALNELSKMWQECNDIINAKNDKINTIIDELDYIRIEAHGSEYYYESTFHRDVFEKLTDIIERLKEND
jgi:hypothetical protein